MSAVLTVVTIIMYIKQNKSGKLLILGIYEQHMVWSDGLLSYVLTELRQQM
jgi:hypothetical protein